MPEKPERRSMVGVPPTARKPRGGGSTPAASTPARTSARSAKRAKKEPTPEEEKPEETSDVEKESEAEEVESEEEDQSTPASKKGRKRKRGHLTDYHLKKKKILARKAQRDADKEKAKNLKVETVETPPREPTPPPVRKAPCFSNYSAFQLMLDHILRKIISKDPEEYFMFPVTKSVAADYHEIIKNPMDFQTIREKIEDKLYGTIEEMKKDCELIVTNAMQYNQPATVFYLAANRLSSLINYYFGEEYVRFIFHSLPFANKVPLDKVGLRPLGAVANERHFNRRRGVLVDSMTSEQCLSSADEKIREKLAARKANTKLAFLGEKDGTVVLNVLSEQGVNSEKHFTLGDVIGPLEEGTPGLLQLAEHRMDSQTPLTYLNYGPYASFAPQYDSTWATMTKEDTDMFLRTYGDKQNTTDVITMKQFVAGCGDHMNKIVDDLLNNVTGGEHSRTLKEVGEMKEEKKIEDFDNEEINMDELLGEVATLANFGIDVSFVDEIRRDLYSPIPQPEEPEMEAMNPPFMQMQHMDIQHQLDHIGQGIQDLAHLQNQRLMQPPPVSLIAVQEPGMLEQRLADNLQNQLTHQVMQHTAPVDFISQPVLHDAMGIDMDDGDLFNEFFVT